MNEANQLITVAEIAIALAENSFISVQAAIQQ